MLTWLAFDLFLDDVGKVCTTLSFVTVQDLLLTDYPFPHQWG